MNKKKALELLKENLEKYLVKGYLFHKRFIEELKSLLIDVSGHEKELFALLIKQLDFVKVLGKEVGRADSNEIIKYMEREYYSLHLQAKNFNIRFLMTFDDDENPIFLAAFYERSGKKASDYSQWKGVLQHRYNEI